MKNSIYRIIIAPLILSVLVISLAYYSIGVVEKNNAVAASLNHIELTNENYKKSETEYIALIKKLCYEYESKAKTISIILSQFPISLAEDMALEELRIAIGAEDISLSDKTGLIVYSTSAGNQKTYIDKHFSAGLDISNFSETHIENDKHTFVAAVSRRDAGGLLICRFSNTTLNHGNVSFSFPKDESSSITATAIINKSEMTYQHHTNSQLKNKKCMIEKEKFETDKQSFSYKISGRSSLVCFKTFDDKIIMSVTPKKDIYTKRNETCAWLITLALLAIGSVILSIRSSLLNESIQKNKA
ncbi:MAG: hypothetical protein J6A58_09305 [Oscillospiraceae bacterium]|nr:hypothetical protein [Oscillospiraceae bacterium]